MESPMCFPEGAVKTRIGELTFENGHPSTATVEKLFEETDFQRACQAYLWALPIVSFAEFQRAHEKVFGAADGDVVIYDDLQSKLGILTSNATTPYIVAFADLDRTGPLVIDIPAGAVAGMVNDFWQRPVTDFGLAGPDKGKGGKYLMVAPNHEDPKAAGYRVFRCTTNNILFGFRILTSDEKEAKALLDMYQIHSYARRDNPPATKLLTTQRMPWSGMPPRGMTYWERLHAILQREPVAERDRFFMAMLKLLGIEKGKPFQPNDRQKKLLTEGALVGEAMAKANDFAKRFQPPFWEGRHWDLALCLDPTQRAESYDQLDERAAWFYEAVTTSAGMVTTTPGIGQTYLAAYKDRQSNWLDGGKNYVLRVPPNAPAKQFWSFTVYDIDTRCLIDNPQKKADLSSRQDLQNNTDGSVDLYFGPEAPMGKEKSWVQTLPGKGWFTYFRLYAPTEAYFDKTWKLPDIEMVGS